MGLKISFSTLKHFCKCPRSLFYSRHPAIPGKTDYHRLCGLQTHRHINYLYKKPKDDRPFFYKTKNSAIRAWVSRWRRALDAESGRLIVRSDESAEKYLQVGINCISRYWDDNINLPRPVQLEKRYAHKIMTGVELIGIFDQARRVSLSYIKKHRPDLIIDGRLAPGYDNVVIVDLKTDYLSYDLAEFKKDATLYENVRHQYELHEDIQATMYTYLYEKATGKKPIGFVWYHLRSGKAFFTYRHERHYQTLYGLVNHFLICLNHESFPKITGPKCKYCDFIEPCNEGDPLLFVEPEDFITDHFTYELVPNIVKRAVDKQLRLNFRLKGQKIPKAFLTEKRTGREEGIILGELPWDRLELSELGKDQEL